MQRTFADENTGDGPTLDAAPLGGRFGRGGRREIGGAHGSPRTQWTTGNVASGPRGRASPPTMPQSASGPLKVTTGSGLRLSEQRGGLTSHASVSKTTNCS